MKPAQDFDPFSDDIYELLRDQQKKSAFSKKRKPKSSSSKKPPSFRDYHYSNLITDKLEYVNIEYVENLTINIPALNSTIKSKSKNL